jgi:hypothetical protein
VSGLTAVKTTDYTLTTTTVGYVEITRNRNSITIPSNQTQLIVTYSHTDPDLDVRLDLINRATRPTLIGQLETVTTYGLLDRAVGLTRTFAMFAGCVNSGFNSTIPPRLFLNSKITDMSSMFSQCYYLSGPLPAALFHNCTSLITTFLMFSNCVSLICDPSRLRPADGELYVIPPGFFDKCSNLTSISRMFESQDPQRPYAPRFVGVLDKDIFRYNIALNNVSNLFAGVINLHGLIDSDTFKNNTNITNLSSCFYATGITGIGPNLFRTCILTTDMSFTFYSCVNLTGYAPSYWASDHPLRAVKSTGSCFKNDNQLLNMTLPTTDPRYIPASWR